MLTDEQADAVRDELRIGATGEQRRGPIAEIVGYLGGALVLTGAVVLVASSWNQLSETARTTLLGLITLGLLTAGFVAAGRHGPRFELATTARLRVAGVLLALASVTTAITIGLAMPDPISEGELAIAGAAGLVVATASYILLPSVAGLLAAAGLLVFTVLNTIEAAAELDELTAGIGLFGCGALLTVLALARLLRTRLTGIGVGLALTIAGTQAPLGDDVAEPVAYTATFLVGVGCLVLYRWVHIWVVLVAGVVAVSLAAPEAVWHLTDGAVGGAAVLLIAGAVLLVASAIGFRLHRNAEHTETEVGTRDTGTRDSRPDNAGLAD
ncbi:hypothetical protein GCM10025762_04470 [Haloechinothrix salitolerans]